MKTISKIFIVLLFLPSTTLSTNNQSFKEDSIKAQKLYSTAIELYRSNNFYAAIDTFKISLELRKKIYGERNYKVGVLENALGISYKTIGREDQALNYFLSAEKSYTSNNKYNKSAIANLYNNIGNLYKNKLDYNTSLEYYKRAINIYSQQKEKNFYDITDTYYNIANIYKNTGDFEESLSIVNQYSSKAYPDTKLYFLDLKAIVYQKLNLPVEAEKAYLEAIAESKELVKKNYLNEIEVGLEYLNYASFLIDFGQMKKAFEILEKAYVIIFPIQPHKGEYLAQYYKIMGYYYESKKVNSKELETFKKQKNLLLTKSISFYKNGLNALNFDSNLISDSLISAEGSLSLIESLNLLKIIADTYVQLAEIYNTVETQYIGNLTNALEYYRITGDLIQQARKEITSEDSKIKLAELEQNTFHKMIETAHNAYNVEESAEIMEFAFKNTERIKASSVFDRLSDELAKNSLIPDSILIQENMLNYNITQKAETLYHLQNEDVPNDKKIAQIDSALFQLKKQREELNQYLEKNYSSYYDLKYSDQLYSVLEIQQKLKKDEVIIEYVFNETDTIPKLYAFFISTEKIRFIQPEIDSVFVESVATAFQFMSNPRYMFTTNEDSKQFCIASNHLYNKLISPFENDIKDKKIMIVPDGKLNYLAFDALIEEIPDTSTVINFAKLKYLIRKNSINYSYSTNLRYRFNNPERKTKNKVLAFAPQYKQDTFMFVDEPMVLVPLTGIQREVDIISDELTTSVFRGNEALEIKFREESENYDILHLAMHAFIDDENPAFSRLAFYQNNSNDPKNNGWLNTADIYNLNLKAKLTVLSACNTGSGKLQRGEGVMSLARGFLYAGCPSIVMTLWEVEDKAGTQIMGAFYKNLKKGRTIDDALRLAKLEYLENANPRTAHPHYWLSYVSIGDNTPLFRSYDYYFFGLLILILIVITVDQLTRVAKSSKNFPKQN